MRLALELTYIWLQNLGSIMRGKTSQINFIIFTFSQNSKFRVLTYFLSLYIWEDQYQKAFFSMSNPSWLHSWKKGKEEKKKEKLIWKVTDLKKIQKRFRSDVQLCCDNLRSRAFVVAPSQMVKFQQFRIKETDCDQLAEEVVEMPLESESNLNSFLQFAICGLLGGLIYPNSFFVCFL